MNKDILLLLIIPVIILIDQVTKKKALLKLKDGQVRSCCRNTVNLTLVKNSGAAFGILKNRQLLLKIINISVITVLLYFFVYFAVAGVCAEFTVPLVFVLGGAIGNLIDRLRFNYVVDFIKLKFKGCPVFNIADIFIFIGSVIFVIISVFLG